jgi:hypothetical protein
MPFYLQENQKKVAVLGGSGSYAIKMQLWLEQMFFNR